MQVVAPSRGRIALPSLAARPNAAPSTALVPVALVSVALVSVARVSVLAVLVLAVSVLGLAGSARAQDDGACPEERSLARGPVEITPSVGARDVTLDAPIVVRYSRGYFGPEGPGDDPTTLLRVVRCPPGARPCTAGCRADEGTDVPGTVQVIEDRLFFLPDAGFEPDATYAGRATGVDDALDFTFCTGDDVDREPPTLGPFLSAEPSESTAECVLPAGGRLVSVRWGQADDDGPGGSIEYLLYLTRAAGVEAPELRDRVRNYASGEITLSLRLGSEEAAEPVCVRMVAIDGVGNQSEPSPEACFDPMTSAAFQPLCAVRGGAGVEGTGRGSALVLAGFSLAVAMSIGRRRRSRARDGAAGSCIR